MSLVELLQSLPRFWAVYSGYWRTYDDCWSFFSLRICINMFIHFPSIIHIQIFFVKLSNDEWPMFLEELIDSSNGNEYLCQNNILIFKNLYEIIYQNDLSVNLCKEKLENLKFSLTSSFDKISKLILSIIDISRNVTLVLRSLDLLELFISIKPDIIKDYDKIFVHLSNLLLVSVIRKDAIRTIIAFCRWFSVGPRWGQGIGDSEIFIGERGA